MSFTTFTKRSTVTGVGTGEPQTITHHLGTLPERVDVQVDGGTQVEATDVTSTSVTVIVAAGVKFTLLTFA